MLIRRQKQGFVSIDEPVENTDVEQGPLQIEDWCCLPEKELLSSEAQIYLDKAVEKLPASLRIVFVLRDIQGLSTLETAEVLELTETAVKTRLSRARLRLRDDLTSYYGEHYLQRTVPEGGRD